MAGKVGIWRVLPKRMLLYRIVAPLRGRSRRGAMADGTHEQGCFGDVVTLVALALPKLPQLP